MIAAAVEGCCVAQMEAVMGPTRVGVLAGNLMHQDENSGTITVYLRLKSIIPPSSEER